MRPADTSITWAAALAWRLRRQFLDPAGELSAADVVGRLGAVRAWPAESAALAIRLRRARSGPDDIDRALAAGEVIRSFSFRGATHLMTPEIGGAYLALRASSRMWELPSWQSYYGLKPSDWPAFREVVRAAVAERPLTQAELGAAITAVPRFAHLGFVFEDKSFTLLKPLAWQGDVVLGGNAQDGRLTFQRPDANPHWRGVPELDVAGPRAIRHYLGAYGPATIGHLRYWLGNGLGAGGRRIDGWLRELGDAVVEIEVDGDSAIVLAEDLQALAAAGPSSAVRLLPAFDQWVMGPGTSDGHVVPPARRKLLGGPANIALAGGVVSGTWAVRGDEVQVSWFAEAGQAPRALIDAEVTRLGAILGRALRSTVGG